MNLWRAALFSHCNKFNSYTERHSSYQTNEMASVILTQRFSDIRLTILAALVLKKKVTPDKIIDNKQELSKLNRQRHIHNIKMVPLNGWCSLRELVLAYHQTCASQGVRLQGIRYFAKVSEGARTPKNFSAPFTNVWVHKGHSKSQIDPREHLWFRPCWSIIQNSNGDWIAARI